MERKNLILDISKIFSEEDISIKGMNARTNKQGKSTISLSFGVSSKGEIGRLTSKLRSIEGVIDIERTQG